MYINATTLDYPITEQEIRSLNENVCFATPFTPIEPFKVVTQTIKPKYDVINQGVRELKPVNSNGTWLQTWEVYDLTPEEAQANKLAKQQEFAKTASDAIQSRLDMFAKNRNYDNILSLCSYATSSNAKFKVEGQHGVEMRDATWVKFYEILAEIEAGDRSIPENFTEIESELPTLSWVSI